MAIRDFKLGLGPSPEKITYLFIGESEDDLGKYPWYEFNHDTGKKIPVHEDSITGYIYNIVTHKKVSNNSKFAPGYKTDVHILADHKYVLRSGANTTFSRGFLLSLDHLYTQYGDEIFSTALTISVKQGEEKSVFCGVFDPQTGDKVFPKWDASSSLFPLVQKMQGALGQVVQTKEMVENYEVYRQAVDKHRDLKSKISDKPKSKRSIKKTEAK